MKCYAATAVSREGRGGEGRGKGREGRGGEGRGSSRQT